MSKLDWFPSTGGGISCGDYAIWAVIPGSWELRWQGVCVFTGSLEKCLSESRRHKRRVRVGERRAELRRQIRKIERSVGGSWRSISKANRLREQLHKLEKESGFEN